MTEEQAHESDRLHREAFDAAQPDGEEIVTIDNEFAWVVFVKGVHDNKWRAQVYMGDGCELNSEDCICLAAELTRSTTELDRRNGGK